jgi:putative integral membrane protein (TIGR02587 family)
MADQRRPAARKSPLARSLREYARGIAGGLLFSLPLLYTMEVWWAGFIARPIHLLLYLGAGFLLLFGYNRYAGLHRDASWLEVGFEAVEETGLGLLVAAGVLWLIGQVDSTMPASEILGKVVVEAVTVAIGISVGSSQLGGGGKGEGGMEGRDDEKGFPGLPAQLVLAACGAVLLASNVAPTEEIVMIAIESSRWKILALALVSYALGGLVLFYSDFRGSHRQAPAAGPATVLLRSAVNYAVALAASAFILWFFGRFGGVSLATGVAQTVALGLVSSLGAATGRLLLQ